MNFSWTEEQINYKKAVIEYARRNLQGDVIERERSGIGQHIDLALLDVQAAMLSHQATSYLVGGEVPGRLGSAAFPLCACDYAWP